MDLASFALPVVGYVAVTTAKWRADVDRLLRDRTPMELDRHNASILIDLGVPRPTWRAFLSHALALAPPPDRHHRHRAGDARRDEPPALLEAASTARSEVGALMQEQQAVRLSPITTRTSSR